jgi:multiple sugar transport system permease protein
VRHIHTAVLLLISLLFLLPVLWLVSAAFYRPATPLPTTLQLWPEGATFANFGRVFAIVPLGRYTLNSLLVVLTAVPLTLLTASWAGLGMARLPQQAQQRWVFLSLAVLMVPGIALWSTRFLVYKWLGWLDSYWALIAPVWMGTSPFFVLMFYRAFRRIPAAVYDVARLDGAGVLALWWRVVLPMAWPTAVAVALLSFIVYWSDFTSPLLYLRRDRLYTLPVALELLRAMTPSDYPLLMAGAVWSLLIPVLLFGIAMIYFSRKA